MGLGPGQERPAKKSGSWPGRVIDGPGACRGDHRTGQGPLCCQLVAGEIQAVKQRSRRDPLSQPLKQAGPIACKREGELHSLSNSVNAGSLRAAPRVPAPCDISPPTPPTPSSLLSATTVNSPSSRRNTNSRINHRNNNLLHHVCRKQHRRLAAEPRRAWRLGRDQGQGQVAGHRQRRGHLDGCRRRR